MEGSAQDTIFGWGDRVDKVDMSDSPERKQMGVVFTIVCYQVLLSALVVFIFVCCSFFSGEQVG